MSWQTTYDASTGEYGKVWVEDEPIIEEPILEQPPTPEQQAVTLMRSMARTSTNIFDDVALSIPDILPTWQEFLDSGEKIQPGICLMHNGQCYRQAQSGEVTPEAHRPPGSEGMSAVYRPIVLGHAGTLEDPIPWVYEMDCEEGKYYSYKGKVYRVAVGGTMKPCLWPPDTPDFWQWEVVA